MNKNFFYPPKWISWFIANHHLISYLQPGRLFLALAIPFGIIFIFLLAPFQAPDEYGHFYRSYAISTGHFTGLEAPVSKSVLEFSQTVSKDLPGNDQNKQSKKALVQEFSRFYEEEPQIKVTIVNSAIVSPLPYLPQAFGILIGRLAHLSPIFIFYLGRIVNFVFWLGLTFLAIKITPVYPRLFVALALMPMTLHQAASNSPDAATIAFSFLFVAFALRMLMDHQKHLRWSDWGIVVLLTIAIALCKSIYVLLAGLLMMIPLRHFRYHRATLPLSLAVIALGLATGLAWLQYSSQWVSVEMINASRTPTTAGIIYIVEHPRVAAPVLWHSALKNTGNQLRMFIGVFGWIDTPLPNWVYPLYYAMLLFIVILEPHTPFNFYLRERLWIAAMAIMASFVLMAIFYYPEVSTSNGVVDTAQGRYYLPFGFLYFLPLSQQKWCLSESSPGWILVALLHGLVLAVSVRAMLWRYYAI